MKLHEKIYYLRTKNRLSQGDLAEILSVSRQSVSKWETGASIPDLDKLIKMSDLFGVTMDFLVRERNEPLLENQKQAEVGEPSETDKKDDISQNTVIIKETFSLRKLFGALLFVGSFILLFIAWPLAIFAAMLGVICFAFRKYTLLWCAWFTYFSTDIYMVTGTAINRTAVFSPYAYEIWGVRILVHWAYLIFLLALIVWTVYIFRYVRYVITPCRRIGCLLGWITVLGIIPLMNFVFSGLIASKLSSLVEMSGGIFTVGTELYEQHEFYIRLMSCMGFVSEWIQIIALTFLLIVMVSWIHMKKKEKINSSTPFTK